MNERTSLQLVEALGNLAIEMRAEPDPDATLRRIVAAAVDLIPGVHWAGVSSVRQGRVETEVPSDDVARALDRRQSELGEGPAIDLLMDQGRVIISDLSMDTRWPRFAQSAVERNVQCLAMFRLFLGRDSFGVLTLYGSEPNVFDEDAVLHAEILAQHVSGAIAGARAVDQMHRAIASRQVIDQAKGVLMERLHVDAVMAFGMLARISQDTGTTLTEVAENVVETAQRQSS